MKHSIFHESMFNTYQDMTKESAVYPGCGEKTMQSVTYCTLGIAGEAGEFVDKMKKVLRGDRTIEEAKTSLAFELGDILWYIARTADELGYDLHEIAQMNINKLADRKKRSVVQGSGDNR